MGIGRQVLGELKRFMALSEIQSHSLRKTLRNGVVIVAMSFIAQEGMADMDKVLIVAPETGGGREKLIGFVVNIAGMDQTILTYNNGLAHPFVQAQPSKNWKTFTNNIIMQGAGSDTTNHDPFGQDLQLCRTGIIEGTYDDTPNLLDNSSAVDKFYYWDTLFSSATTYGPATVIGKTVQPPDDPHFDLPYQNLTGKGCIAPVNSRRLPMKAIGLYCKAAGVAPGKITCEDTNTDGFIAVVKKPIEVNFDDATWDETKTKFTAAFSTYNTFTVFANGDVEGTNIHNFPGSPFATNMATVATYTTTQSVSPKNFEFETDTEDEEWIINGVGESTLYLISTKQVYTVKHTFPDTIYKVNDPSLLHPVIYVDLGKEFGKIDEVYHIKEIDI